MSAPAIPLVHDGKGLKRMLARAERMRKLRAFGLTVPLLVYLVLVFLVPLSALLVRAVESPEVADALPRTVASLSSWDRESAPPAQAFKSLADDLAALPDQSDAGALARRLNSAQPGARSLVMGAYRGGPYEGDAAAVKAKILAADDRWGDVRYWQAIAKNGSRWTPDYLLAALDLRRDAAGHIERMPPDQRAYVPILLRTFGISGLVTLCCLLLAYPLAYWLSTLPARQANVLLIFILVPFWTSMLVRLAAWIVVLQGGGVVNHTLQSLGLVSEPLQLLFNRTGVVTGMTHILLPYMLLPMYSVMKSVPPTYLRAAVSLGSPPLGAFARVYVPQTYPGVGAGLLLTFILAIGYYVTPAILGGADDQMLSRYVADYANVTINWGMACALGSVLLVATLVLYAVYRRVTGAELSLS